MRCQEEERTLPRSPAVASKFSYWRRQSQAQNTTMESCQYKESNTIKPIEFKYNSYKSIERDHQSENLQKIEETFLWIGPSREEEAKPREYLRVSTVTTTFLLLGISTPISISVYIYSSSNLEEGHGHKHSTANMQIHYSREAYKWKQTIIKTKPTYRRGSAYEWSTLTATHVCMSEQHLRRRHPTIYTRLLSESLSWWKRTIAAIHCASISAVKV